jgi:hypothetical protein
MDSGLVVSLDHGIALWQAPEGHALGRFEEGDVRNAGNRFELYFESNDLETLNRNLKEKSIPFFQEIHEESWGQKTFRFFDPDGHLLEVGETLRTFISRMEEAGMSLGQISEKTGMKVEDIQKVLMSHE